MKWNSHIIIGASYSLSIGKFEPAIIAALATGSILPDVMDKIISFGSDSLWHKVHRKISHWWLFYIILVFGSLNSGWYYPYFIFTGCLLHIYTDSLTVSGVPFLNPFKSGYGLRKASTGTITEYVYAAIMIAFMLTAGFLHSYIPLWITLSVFFIASSVSNKKPDIGNDKKKEPQVQAVDLSDLAGLWTKDKNTAVKIPIISKQPAEPDVIFGKHELNEFYQVHVTNLPGREIIAEILKILDTKGDCPSVVNRSTDINPYTEPSTFTALAKVPLWQHTLHVAMEILKTVNNPGAYASQLLMAALGHDLGKSQALDRTMYNMGDHPKISVLLLEGINGFNNLAYKNDIETAILSHHRTGGGSLADHLRDADRNARRAELAEMLPTLDAGDVYEPDNLKPSAQSSTGSIFETGKCETEAEKRPTETELSWLDIDDFINALKARINVLAGRRFDAFSMKDGIVYFQTDLFWKVLKKLARDNGHDDVLLADSDQEMRRNYLFTITEMLREKRFIADGLIKSGYFSAPFVVDFKDGSSFSKAYYTPMVSEAFGDVSELENQKTGILNEILTVKPKYQDEEQ